MLFYPLLVKPDLSVAQKISPEVAIGSLKIAKSHWMRDLVTCYVDTSN